MRSFIDTSPLKGKAWQVTLLGALLAVSAGAQAAQTASGTNIDNIAKLSYKVNNVDQEEICSSTTGNSTGNGGTSGTTCSDGTNGAENTRFVVDKKIDVFVLTVDATPGVNVVAGQNAGAAASTDPVLEFTVTNQGNDTQDINLTASAKAAGTWADVFASDTSVDSDFAATSCAMYIDDGDGNFEPGVGAGLDGNSVTVIDDLASDTSKTIWVRCSIPTSATNGQQAVVSLTAEARDTAGGALTNDADGNDPLAVDILFADDTGSDDAATDAKHSDRNAYNVATSDLSVKKTVGVVCDPVNGANSNLTTLAGTNVYNIPGALVRYTITISNGVGASSAATLSSVADQLQVANLTFDDDYENGASAANCIATADDPASGTAGDGFRVTCVANVGGTRACHSTPQFFTTGNDGPDDGGNFTSPDVSLDFSKILPAADGGHNAGELKAGESVTVQFQAFIQ